MNIERLTRSLRNTAWNIATSDINDIPTFDSSSNWQRGLDKSTRTAAASVCAESSSWELRSLGASSGQLLGPRCTEEQRKLINKISETQCVKLVSAENFRIFQHSTA